MEHKHKKGSKNEKGKGKEELTNPSIQNVLEKFDILFEIMLFIIIKLIMVSRMKQMKVGG